jgi:C_GCAxxG_C_C family probable redox protein
MISKSEVISNAQARFDEGYACSQSVLLAFSDQFNLDEQTAKLISSTFGGGMGRLRQKCGAVTSGFMVLGLAYGNKIPTDMETKLGAYKKVRELDHQVEELYGTTNCKELLQKYASQTQVEERKHHQLICRQVVSDTAGLVFDQLKHDGKI